MKRCHFTWPLQMRNLISFTLVVMYHLQFDIIFDFLSKKAREDDGSKCRPVDKVGDSIGLCLYLMFWDSINRTMYKQNENFSRKIWINQKPISIRLSPSFIFYPWHFTLINSDGHNKIKQKTLHWVTNEIPKTYVPQEKYKNSTRAKN